MRSWIKPALFIVCLIPLAQLAYGFYTDDLTANPIEYITRFTGSWALIILITSLAVTPSRKIFGWNALIRYRRMLGLFAFFYAVLHFLIYMVLDHFFDFQAIAKDIYKRPYVTAGFTSFVLMVPLALTSTAAMIRRLGKRWQQLHRLAYIRRPVQYGAVLALLLGVRLAYALSATASKRVSGKTKIIAPQTDSSRSTSTP
jgi:sulfoxide reductase heme-binding subunit YedZ